MRVSLFSARTIFTGSGRRSSINWSPPQWGPATSQPVLRNSLRGYNNADVKMDDGTAANLHIQTVTTKPGGMSEAIGVEQARDGANVVVDCISS
jgi:hypothetical protein